ncbi:4742_t:CDS:2, partial [Racocetra persica]
RSCIRCKRKKTKCNKDNGPNCEACIRKGEECVTPENTNKRGPKPRLLIPTAVVTVPSNKSSKEQKNKHPQGLHCLNANTQQLPENVQYGTFGKTIEDVMINGDKGEDYERKQNLQLSEKIQNKTVSFDFCESSVSQPLSESMINGDNSHFNIDLAYWLPQYESPSMSQNSFNQMPKDYSAFFSTQEPKFEAEVIQNGLPKDGEKGEHFDIAQYWDDYWADYLKERGE